MEHYYRYWRRNGLSFDQMLRNASASVDSLIARCEQYDEDTVQEFLQVGTLYSAHTHVLL